MKKFVPLAGLLLLFSAGTLWADAPGLRVGVFLKAGGSDIDVGSDAIPACVDWNNDGKKDLLTGEITYGNITLFLNTGTDLNPVFNTGTLVESGGTPITVTYG
jgi:hypothetical protein